MMRGMSALKGKGIHENMRLTVGIKDLLEPVAEDKITPEVGDENHGLWGFFNKDRSLLTRPEDLGNHGRAWTRQELRRKSWDDLHSLWWICLKERNRLATEDVERERLKAGYGEFESRARQDKIRSTMRRIKSVLRERWYNWEDARKLALSDPEIHVTEDGRVQYVPTAVCFMSSAREICTNDDRINTTPAMPLKRMSLKLQLSKRTERHLRSLKSQCLQRRRCRKNRRMEMVSLEAWNPSFQKTRRRQVCNIDCNIRQHLVSAKINIRNSLMRLMPCRLQIRLFYSFTLVINLIPLVSGDYRYMQRLRV